MGGVRRQQVRQVTCWLILQDLKDLELEDETAAGDDGERRCGKEIYNFRAAEILFEEDSA